MFIDKSVPSISETQKAEIGNSYGSKLFRYGVIIEAILTKVDTQRLLC